MTLKETNKKTKSEQIWLTIFLTIPVGILFPLSEFFEVSGTTKILISGAFGGLGGAIGFGIYSLFKTKNSIFKGTVLGLMLLTGIATIFFVKSYNSNLITCEVCGYKAIEKSNTDCQLCDSYTWKNEVGDYANKKDWIEEEQLYWFSYPGFQETDFFNPEIQEGFLKDEDWTPSISESQVNNYLTGD